MHDWLVPTCALFAGLCTLQESQSPSSHAIKAKGNAMLLRHNSQLCFEAEAHPKSRKKGGFFISGKNFHPEIDTCYPAKHSLVEASVFSQFSGEVSM